MKKAIFTLIIVGLSIISTQAQIQITVNPAQEIKEISPYIYGRNNSLSDKPSNPTTAAKWKLYKDAGVKMFRESGGNNSTKYNWRKKKYPVTPTGTIMYMPTIGIMQQNRFKPIFRKPTVYGRSSCWDM